MAPLLTSSRAYWRGGIEPALETQHESVGMGAVKFGGEFEVRFENVRHGLFHQDALPPRDQRGGVRAVLIGRGHNHRRVRNPCVAQFFDGAKNWNIAARLGGELLGPPWNRVAKRGECAISGFLGQFVNMKGMDTPHPAQARNSNSDRLVHRLTQPPSELSVLLRGSRSALFDSSCSKQPGLLARHSLSEA